MKDIKKTEYKYTYANGEVITITAKALGTETDKWIEILVHMDKTELNNERAETRRHISIDESDPEGVIFASKDCVEQLVEDKELMMMFYKTLSGNERYVFIGRYVDGLTMDEVAKELHLTKGRICQIQKIICSKMISFFSTY